MGTGICKAVEAVFPTSRDFVCHFHFHFLRDAGKDLIDPAYGRLRSCLRRHALSTRLSALAREARRLLLSEQEKPDKTAITTASELNLTTSTAVYAIALWCLQAKHSGDGYGFPFDRPLLLLAERLISLLDCLPQLMKSLDGDCRQPLVLTPDTKGG